MLQQFHTEVAKSNNVMVKMEAKGCLLDIHAKIQAKL